LMGRRRIWRVPLLAAGMLSLVWGVWLGLLRIGWALPLPWPDQLILHGPLMIGGFLGTLIGVERSVAFARPWAYAAPICSAAGAILLVLGPPGPAGPLLVTMASAIVTAMFVVMLRRDRSLFVATMSMGAAAWLIGNAQWWAGAAIYRIVYWWIAFVVLTIAAERLELNRVLRPGLAARAAFIGAVALLVAGIVLMTRRPETGARVAGLGLLAVSGWLGVNDVARRTVRQAWSKSPPERCQASVAWCATETSSAVACFLNPFDNERAAPDVHADSAGDPLTTESWIGGEARNFPHRSAKIPQPSLPSARA
jgi:hypothetical protein